VKPKKFSCGSRSRYGVLPQHRSRFVITIKVDLAKEQSKNLLIYSKKETGSNTYQCISWYKNVEKVDIKGR
jgi:hypothetical protein